jgi:predicted DNA-binding protein
MNYVEDVSAADQLAAVVAGTGISASSSVARAISYRVPVSTLSRVDALAAKSGKSRNAMLNLLVNVGLEEVFVRLSQDDFREVQSLEIGLIGGLLSVGSESLEE